MNCPYKLNRCERETTPIKIEYLCESDMFFKCDEYSRIIEGVDVVPSTLERFVNPYGNSAKEFLDLMGGLD